MAGYYSTSVHTLVHPSQLSNYSSLAGALTPVPPPSQFTSSSRERVPQTACKAVNEPVFMPVAFDYFSQSRQGVALRDFSVKSQGGINHLLSGANEVILANTGIQKIDLRIMWLGYEHIDCSFTFPVPRTTTKGQLGSLIAKQFRKFCEKATSSTTTVRDWRIGPDAITFDQLYLVALYSFGDGVCQADIAVDPAPAHRGH
ncbi:hypothetical protein D9756_002041 [Leucocoprinus leucothites]|uniref:Uncharacterized protein n=1 Tax=Leucocoprinus leucothites TaxID=201217 RepID=A0A8H5GCD9_9AGAR|nr:hypothetical protein D9756_002041 [Leucoagaricus leucothites]